MKSSKLRELSNEELSSKHVDIESELSKLRVRQGIRQLEQPSRLRLLRRDLARVKTIMNERASSVR